MKEETGRLTTTGEDERGRKGAALRGCPVGRLPRPGDDRRYRLALALV